MKVADPRYRPICRSTVSRNITKLTDRLKAALTEKLNAAVTVNVTVNIWSDRRMRAFLGVTVHFVDFPSSGKPESLHFALACWLVIDS